MRKALGGLPLQACKMAEKEAKKREQRRRKILENANSRLEKLTGAKGPRNTPPASTQYFSTSTEQEDNNKLGTSNDQEQNKSLLSRPSLYYKFKYTMSSKLHVLAQIATSITIAIAIKMQLSTSIIGASLLSNVFILSIVFLHIYNQNDHTHHYPLTNSSWLDSIVSLMTSIYPPITNEVNVIILLITVAQLFIYNIMLTLFFTVFISCIL